LGKAAARLARVAERASGVSGLRETSRVDAGLPGSDGVAFSEMVEVVAIRSGFKVRGSRFEVRGKATTEILSCAQNDALMIGTTTSRSE
jgi:hypothetical protein